MANPNMFHASHEGSAYIDAAKRSPMWSINPVALDIKSGKESQLGSTVALLADLKWPIHTASSAAKVQLFRPVDAVALALFLYFASLNDSAARCVGWTGELSRMLSLLPYEILSMRRVLCAPHEQTAQLILASAFGTESAEVGPSLQGFEGSTMLTRNLISSLCLTSNVALAATIPSERRFFYTCHVPIMREMLKFGDVGFFDTCTAPVLDAEAYFDWKHSGEKSDCSSFAIADHQANDDHFRNLWPLPIGLVLQVDSPTTGLSLGLSAGPTEQFSGIDGLLCSAVIENQPELVRWFLERFRVPASVLMAQRLASDVSMSLFHVAVHRGAVPCLRVLLDHVEKEWQGDGMHPVYFLLDSKDRNLLHLAAEEHRTDVLETLRRRYTPCTFRGSPPAVFSLANPAGLGLQSFALLRGGMGASATSNAFRWLLSAGCTTALAPEYNRQHPIDWGTTVSAASRDNEGNPQRTNSAEPRSPFRRMEESTSGSLVFTPG